METSQPQIPFEITQAALYGLGHEHGAGPEVLDDRGVAVDGDDAASQYASGQRVAELIAANSSAETPSPERTAHLAAFCGDCLVEVKPDDSCGHISVAANGKRKIHG